MYAFIAIDSSSEELLFRDVPLTIAIWLDYTPLGAVLLGTLLWASLHSVRGLPSTVLGGLFYAWLWLSGAWYLRHEGRYPRVGGPRPEQTAPSIGSYQKASSSLPILGMSPNEHVPVDHDADEDVVLEMPLDINEFLETIRTLEDFQISIVRAKNREHRAREPPIGCWRGCVQDGHVV